MLRKMWTSLMRAKNNSLHSLPKTVRLQIMVILSAMWCLIFSISVGVFYLFPGLILVHLVLLIVGIFGTGWVFSLFDKGSSD